MSALALHWEVQDVSLQFRKGPLSELTRATTAIFRDWENIQRLVAANEPRFEGARRVENLILQANDIDTTWTNNLSVEVQGATDSIGGATAWTITDDSSTGAGTVSMRQALGLKSGHKYTFSAEFRADQLDFARISFAAYTGAAAYAYFDLTNGVLGVDLGADNDSAGIKSLGSGWYRCWVVATIAADTTGRFDMLVCQADGNVSVDLDGTSSIHAARVMVEDVSGQIDPSPSEYLATTTAAVAKLFATRRVTNIANDSDSLGDWSLSQNGGAIVTGQADPFAGTDAVLFPDDNGGGTGTVRHLVSVAPTGTPLQPFKDYRISVFLKRRTGTSNAFVAMRHTGLTGTNNVAQTYFDIANGAVGSDTDGKGTIMPAANDFFRCEFYFRTAADVAGQAMNIYSVESNGGAISSCLRNGDRGCIAYGWQVEPIPASLLAGQYVSNDNTDGTLVSSAFDEPLTVVGMPPEPARTNLAFPSQDLTTTWTVGATAAAVVGDQAIAVDGTLTMDRVIDNNAGGTGNGVYAQIAITSIPTTGDIAISIVAKPDGLDWIWLRPTAYGSLDLGAYFDLTNQVVGATTGADNTTEYIEDMGNGLVRCVIVAAADGTDTNMNLRCFVAEADGDNVVDLDGTSSVLFRDVQLEAGSFASSIIPTVGGTVTRNKDDWKKESLTEINAAEGIVYAKIVTGAVTATNDAILFLTDGSTDDGIQLLINDGNRVRCTVRSGGVTQSTSQSTLQLQPFTEYEIAAGWKEDNFIVYVSGTAGIQDTSGSAPVAPVDQIHIGQRYDELQQSGLQIAAVRVFDSWDGDIETIENASNGIFPAAIGEGFSSPLAGSLSVPLSQPLQG